MTFSALKVTFSFLKTTFSSLKVTFSRLKVTFSGNRETNTEFLSILRNELARVCIYTTENKKISLTSHTSHTQNNAQCLMLNA